MNFLRIILLLVRKVTAIHDYVSYNSGLLSFCLLIIAASLYTCPTRVKRLGDLRTMLSNIQYLLMLYMLIVLYYFMFLIGC